MGEEKKTKSLRSISPRKPKSKSEVRFAAGTISFENSHGKAINLRVFHELDKIAGVWVSTCLEHNASITTEPGRSLGEAHEIITEELHDLLNQGILFDFQSASKRDIDLWKKVKALNFMSRACGNTEKSEYTLNEIKPNRKENESSSERYYRPPQNKILIAA